MAKLREYLKYLMKHAELERMTDHYYFRYTRPDGRTIKIKCSFGNGEIPAGVWRGILKQLGITQEEFNRG